MKKADIQEVINKLEDLRDEAHGESSYQEYLENWKDCNYHYGRYKGLDEAIEVLKELLEKKENK